VRVGGQLQRWRVLRRPFGNAYAFVVSQKNGLWGRAGEVPGTGALNKGKDAGVSSVSCASAGNCSAGGFYRDAAGIVQVFVVSEKNGRWGKAQEVPGTAALNRGRTGASIGSVSCASAGNCSAGGGYTTAARQQLAFVVSEKSGIWAKAQAIRGLASLSAGIDSVSCAAAGNCSAGGSWGRVTGGGGGLFVVSEKSGIWGRAQAIRGLGARADAIGAVSCGSAGNCSAGGFSVGKSGAGQAFVVSEQDGTWGTAEEVPGLAALNTGGDAEVSSVSCTPAGNCGAGGYYVDARGIQAFVVSEKNGTWRTAEEVPGTAALNIGGNAQVSSVSCASAGNCSAGGYYNSRKFKVCHEGFVVSERNGTWRAAERVPGTAPRLGCTSPG
jgi:hypothetical protein